MDLLVDEFIIIISRWVYDGTRYLVSIGGKYHDFIYNRSKTE